MKKWIQIPVLFVLGFAFVGLQAQDCATYFPYEEGRVLKYENFNKKGKSEGTVTHTISEVKNSSDGMTLVMHSTMVDDKGKDVFESDFEVQCTGDGYSVRLTDMMMPQMTEQINSMEVDMEMKGENLYIPNDLSVGKTLPDASMEIQPNMGGMNIMKFQYTTTDRRVSAKESVTTPAGSFDCFLLESSTNIKTIGNRVFTSKEWFAEGVGIVRSETYNQKGKLMGSMELVAVE
jgi:hypothetical protein